jgi:hypothetical protein
MIIELPADAKNKKIGDDITMRMNKFTRFSFINTKAFNGEVKERLFRVVL